MPKSKGGSKAASKLGYEDTVCTTIDGREYKMGDHFLPDDFAVSDNDNEIVVKHDGMQRVLFRLFDVESRIVQVHECPKKSNEWCAVVGIQMVMSPRVTPVTGTKKFTWGAVADCRTSNAMPGMGRYTTAVAETRASGRIIRRLLGLEGFCTKEELAETTLDVEDDSRPMDDGQLALVKRFLNDTAKKYADITVETINKRLKRKEGEEGFITDNMTDDDWKSKLSVGQAADLIDKLHRYDIKKAED